MGIRDIFLDWRIRTTRHTTWDIGNMHKANGRRRGPGSSRYRPDKCRDSTTMDQGGVRGHGKRADEQDYRPMRCL
jgi:hypothetical protein